MVAHLVGGIGQHDDELVHARRYAAQQHGEPVPRKDGEDEPHSAAASLGADILRDLLHGGVIALRAGDHRFGNGEHIAVLNVKSGRGVVAASPAAASRLSTAMAARSSPFLMIGALMPLDMTPTVDI